MSGHFLSVSGASPAIFLTSVCALEEVKGRPLSQPRARDIYLVPCSPLTPCWGRYCPSEPHHPPQPHESRNRDQERLRDPVGTGGHAACLASVVGGECRTNVFLERISSPPLPTFPKRDFLGSQGPGVLGSCQFAPTTVLGLPRPWPVHNQSRDVTF